MLTVDKYLTRIDKYNNCEKCIFREVNCAGGMVCYGGAPIEPYCATLSQAQLDMSLRECITGISHIQHLEEKRLDEEAKKSNFFNGNFPTLVLIFERVMKQVSISIKTQLALHGVISVAKISLFTPEDINSKDSLYEKRHSSELNFTFNLDCRGKIENQESCNIIKNAIDVFKLHYIMHTHSQGFDIIVTMPKTKERFDELLTLLRVYGA